MKKLISIALALVLMISCFAIASVGAAETYTYEAYNTTTSSSPMKYTINSGSPAMTNYANYMTGYSCKQIQSANEFSVTFSVDNLPAGEYDVNLVHIAHEKQYRGVFDVSVNGGEAQTVDFASTGKKKVEVALDAKAVSNGVDANTVTFTVNTEAGRSTHQIFLYSISFVPTGEVGEPESSTVTETTTTTTTTTTQAPVATESYSYVIYDNMEKEINPPNTEVATAETDNMIIKVTGGILNKYANYISGYNCAQWNDSSENIALGFELKNIPAGEYKLTLNTADNNSARGTFDVTANNVALGEMNCLNKTGKKLTEHTFDTTFKADGRRNVNITVTPTETTTNRQIFLYSIVLTKVADYVPTPEVEITMVQGASVRFNEVTGMRYKATVNTEDVAYYEAEGYTVTMGTLIAPADKLTYETLTFQADANNFLDVVTTGYFNEETGTIAGSISNIKEANYGRNFIARSYVKLTKDGETYVSYATANDNTRSIKTLANAVLDDDTMIPENEAQLELLNKWAAASDWA